MIKNREQRSKDFFKKIFILVVAIAIVASMVSTRVMATDVTEGTSRTLSDYDQGDIAAVNKIIANNGLSGYTQNDPENWPFIQWTNDVPKKVASMYFMGETLTGDLVLSGLNELSLVELSSESKLNSVTFDNLPNVTSVSVRNCDALKVFSAKNLPNIANININYNFSLEKIDVSNMPNLTQFLVEGNPAIKTLEIKEFPLLGYLNFYDNEEVTSLKLENLPALRAVYINANKSLTDLQLNDLPELSYLSMRGNISFKELKISGLPKLQEVHGWENGFESVDFSDLPSLRNIFISASKVSTLNLVNLPNLVYMDFSMNQIVEVDFRNLPKLLAAGLNRNKIYDVSKVSENFNSANARMQNVERTFYTTDVSKSIDSFQLPAGTVILRGRDGIANNVATGNPAYSASNPGVITTTFVPNGNMLTADIGELTTLDKTYSIQTESYVINLIPFEEVIGEDITFPEGSGGNITYGLKSTILPGYTPTFTFEQLDGKDNFTVDENGKVTGIKEGSGQVKIVASTEENTRLKSETTINVTITKVAEKPNQGGKTFEGEGGKVSKIDSDPAGTATGDDSNMTVWIIAGAVALALVIALFALKGKKKN